MDINIISGAIVVGLALFFMTEKFMAPGRWMKLVCILCLTAVISICLLIFQFLYSFDLIVQFFVISFFINYNIKNYRKSANIALAILIAYTSVVIILSSIVFFILPDTLPREGNAFHSFMMVGVLSSSLIFRKYNNIINTKSSDSKILLFYLSFKIIVLIVLNFAIPLYFVANAELSMEVLFTAQFAFAIVVAITFILLTKLLEYNDKLESENREAAIDLVLTRQTVEAENVNKRYNEIVKFKHFTTSVYRSIVGYLTEKDYEGLHKYYDEYIAPINSQLNKELGEYKQINHIHIPIIKARIIELINIVSQLPNINLYVHVDNIIADVAMKEMDLYKIINIYIDNAVEEVTMQDREEKKITIQMDKTHDRFLFVIKNTLVGCESTPKPNNTGRGIELALEVIEKYDAFIGTNIEQGMYIQRLEVYNE